MIAARWRWRLTGTAWRLAWIAAGLAAAAVNTGNNLLYLLLGLALGVVPLAIAAAWWNLSRVTVELATPRWVVAGAAWSVDLHVRRDRRWASRGLELRLRSSRRSFGPAWVEKLAGGGKLSLSVPAAGCGRGIERIEGMALRSSFPLGIVTRTIEFECDREVLVLPHAAPVEAPPAGEIATHADGSSQLRPGSPGNAHEGVRRGGDGEDLRWVDWKATARRGALMLREPAGEGTRQTQLNLVTVLADRTPKDFEHFEREVSRIAGIGRAALQTGGRVQLTLDGRDGQSWSGPSGITPFLSRLARTEPRDREGRIVSAAPAPERNRDLGHAASEATAARTGSERCHRVSAMGALAVGIVTLFAYDGIGIVRFAVLASAFAAVVASRGKWVARPRGVFRTLWNVASLIALTLFAAELAWWRSPLEASISLVWFITLYLLFNAVTARDDRLVLLVSLMQLVLGAALTTDVTFALPLLAWLVLVLQAQTEWTSTPPRSPEAHRPLLLEPAGPPWRHLRPALASAGALAFTGLALFAIIPHWGTGAFDPPGVRAQHEAGFSESTRLGDIGRIKRDNRPVMEAALDRLPAQQFDLKWRGTALEDFDGRSWKRSPSPSEALPADGSRWNEDGERETIGQEFRLEPTDSPVIFAAERPVAVDSPDLALLSRDESGTLEGRSRRRGRISYAVTSAMIPREPTRLREANGAEPEELLERNLALPELDPRIPSTAREIIAASPTRYDAARAIESWVSTRQYSLDVNDVGSADPLAAFLFEGMAGHCEYYATSMVVLARAVGIPARFVKGYLRGDTNRFSRRYLVRRSDAHAWVEVHFPGIGWVPFDPTPLEGRASTDALGFVDLLADLHATITRLWDDHLIGVDLNDQYDALLAVRERLLDAARTVRARGAAAMGIVASVGLVIALSLTWRRRVLSAERKPRLPAFYRKLLRWLARRGVERRPAETPDELARRAALTLPAESAASVLELTTLYYAERFRPSRGPRSAPGRAEELLASLGRRTS